MSNKPVLVERDGYIALVTLNDPDTLNALSTEMMQELGRVWPELDADPKCRVVVLTGAGERGFCSGLRAQNIDADPEKRPAGYPRFTPRQCGLWKPVVVAVNGVCASGGLHFLSHAEIEIAIETSRFSGTSNTRDSCHSSLTDNLPARCSGKGHLIDIAALSRHNILVIGCGGIHRVY